MAAEPTEIVAAPPAPAPVTPSEPLRPRLWPTTGLRIHVAMILTLGTAVLLAYSNSFIAGLSFDSRQLVLDDPRVQAAGKSNLRLIFRTDYQYPRAVSGVYRPITTLSYWFNYAGLDGGTTAAGYHWFNFLLHWANATLVYYLLLMLTGNVWPAFLTAALFAMHPVATEAVTDIAGRAQELAAAGVLGGMLLYLRSHVQTGRRKVLWLLALTAVATLAALACESALVLVGLMLVYDLVIRLPRWREEKPAPKFWDVAAGYGAWLPAGLIWWFVRARVYAGLPAAQISWLDNPLLKTDAWTARLTAIKVIGKYLWLLVWPQTLSCDYSFNQIPLATWRFTNWESLKTLIALAAMVWLVLVAIRFVRRNRPLAFCLFFFGVALLPVSNLFTLQEQIMAERYLYLPLVGFAGAVVFAVYGLCRLLVARLRVIWLGPAVWLQMMARTVLLGLAAGLGVRAWQRNIDWETNLQLWTSAVAAAPDSYKTHRSLAFAMYENDRKTGDDKKSIDDVIQEAELARGITDEDLTTLVQLGHYYVLKGSTVLQRAPDGTVTQTQPLKHWYGKAIEDLTRAAQLDCAANVRYQEQERRLGRPTDQIRDIGNFNIYWNIGAIEVQLQNYEAALRAYHTMRHLAPVNPDSYLGLASVYLGLRDYEKAAIPLLQAFLLDNSRSETLQSLVDVYRRVDREGCAIEFSHGEPKLDYDCQIVRNNLCAAYAGLIQALTDAKQYASAKSFHQQAIQTGNCSAEQLASPAPTATVTAPSIP